MHDRPPGEENIPKEIPNRPDPNKQYPEKEPVKEPEPKDKKYFERTLCDPEHPPCHPEHLPCHPEYPLCHPEHPLCHPERSEGSGGIYPQL